LGKQDKNPDLFIFECSYDPKHTNGWQFVENSHYCPVCGSKLKYRDCCKKWLEQNAAYCSECGKPLKPAAIIKEIEDGSIELIEEPKKKGGKKKK
jgi:predicted RNA-binding Zn-ribbon protein involved in translation (DUF1610 family)